MNEIKTLLGLELRSLFGINKILHTKDTKVKLRYKRLSIAWIILLAMCCFYVGTLVYGLCSFGLSNIAPLYLVAISSLLIFVFGIFSAGYRIFSKHGYDTLISMPIKKSSIVISRFITLYLENLVISLAIILPGIITYGVMIKPVFTFYLMMFFATLLIPAIPQVISILIGTLIMFLTSKVKNKSMFQSIFSILFMVAIIVGSYTMGNSSTMTAEQISTINNTMTGSLQKIYFPSVWINNALIHQNVLELLLFIGVSMGFIAIAFFATIMLFDTIIKRLSTIATKNNYKIKDMTSGNQIKSLYLKEAKRYFASSIYVTNTILGQILGTILSIAIAVLGINKISAYLPLGINFVTLFPFLISGIFCMMSTTSISISMEGKEMWIIKSMPISTKTWLDSKILFNLSLNLPFYIISEIALIIGLRPSIIEAVWIITIPILIITFLAVLGITINLKFHSFDWDKEATIVKQSLPALLGGIPAFLICTILGIILSIIPTSITNFALLGISILLIVGTILLYFKNNKAKIENL